MNEQTLNFREDLKKSIDYVRLKYNRRWIKRYYNAGFKTEEEFKKAVLEAKTKADSIMKDFKKDPEMCFYHETHIAYYILKHNLNKEQQILYINQQWDNRKHNKEQLNCNSEFDKHIFINRITSYLESYEKQTICSN